MGRMTSSSRNFRGARWIAPKGTGKIHWTIMIVMKLNGAVGRAEGAETHQPGAERSAAPGGSGNCSPSPERATQTDAWIVSPFQGFIRRRDTLPRAAAVLVQLASPCPGLICRAPSGQRRRKRKPFDGREGSQRRSGFSGARSVGAKGTGKIHRTIMIVMKLNGAVGRAEGAETHQPGAERSAAPPRVVVAIVPQALKGRHKPKRGSSRPFRANSRP